MPLEAIVAPGAFYEVAVSENSRRTQNGVRITSTEPPLKFNSGRDNPGGGGEIRFGTFLASELPETIEINVGKPGRGGESGDGEDGRDTTFGDLLRAKGGRGGKAGHSTAMPQQARGLAPPGIRISSAFLGDYAEVREGLFSAIGCGWSAFLVDRFPGVIHGCLVVLAEANDGDDRPESTLDLGFELLDPETHVVAHASLRFNMRSQHKVARLPGVIRFSANVSDPGIWVARVKAGNDELVRQRFEVKLRQDP